MTEQEALKYIESVNWCFAKTYTSAPHEYTISAWKPELHNKMIEFARYIREHGTTSYFYRTPFIKLVLDGYEYWTMPANIEDTEGINRTFADKSRIDVVKKYATSGAYIHEHRESLIDVEKRAKQWLCLLSEQ